MCFAILRILFLSPSTLVNLLINTYFVRLCQFTAGHKQLQNHLVYSYLSILWYAPFKKKIFLRRDVRSQFIWSNKYIVHRNIGPRSVSHNWAGERGKPVLSATTFVGFNNMLHTSCDSYQVKVLTVVALMNLM